MSPLKFFASSLIVAGFALRAMAEASPADLARQLQGVFREKCAACHSPESTNKSAKSKWKGPDFVASLTPKYVPAGGRTEAGTELWKILGEDKSMPPEPEPGETAKAAPLSGPELAIVAAWLRAGAPVPVDPKAVARVVHHITDVQVQTFIRDDLDRLSERQRRNTRYYTLTHFYNNLSEKDEVIEVYRQGVKKMLNSLTWMPDPVIPQAIDPERTIYRINLLDLDWEPALWDELAATYPYGVDYANDLAADLVNRTGSKLPVLRGDWLVFTVSQPFFYHKLLGLKGGDGALADLEARLNVKRIRNIRNGRVVRAGIDDGHSGVSANNRLIERHAAAYGAYWLSYDFLSSVGESSLLDKPLGPSDAFNGALAFKHAGGEVIFNLPNHMQGYLLINAAGKRLDDAAPVKIVNIIGARKPEIFNGLSCIECHYAGMRSATDEVRGHVQNKRGAFNEKALDFIEELYPPTVEFNKKLKRDEDSFRAAMAAIGITNGSAFTLDGEPVHVLSERFIQPVTLASAAAEVGMTSDDFRQRLAIADDPDLRATLARFREAGVPRLKFIADFDRIVSGAGVGKRIVPDPPVVPGRVEAVARAAAPGIVASTTFPQMAFVRIEPGTFTMGSPVGEEGRKKDETPHTVTLTKAYYMGRHDVTRGQFAAFVAETNFQTDAEKKGDGFVYVADKDTSENQKGVSWRNPGFVQGDDHPVVLVSWNDAVAFARWMSDKEKRAYRLPTEAQWEFACRNAAKDTKPFNTGDTISTDQANYDGNFVYGNGVKGEYRKRTTPVGTFAKNGRGLFDMHGNVWQWCYDIYADYPKDAVTDPAGVEQNKDNFAASRVLRGGSWIIYPQNCRSAYRLRFASDYRFYIIGFRLCLDFE